MNAVSDARRSINDGMLLLGSISICGCGDDGDGDGGGHVVGLTHFGSRELTLSRG